MIKRITFLLLLIALGSCGNYNKIRYHKAKQSNKDVVITKKETAKVDITSSVDDSSENNDYASIDDNIELNQFSETKPKSFLKVQEDDSCDVILFRDGEVIVLEVGIDEIKYKECKSQNGPSFTLEKSEVFSIKYRNGKKDIFENKKKTNLNVRKQHPAGIIGLILSLIMIPTALFISPFLLLLSIPVIVLGIIGLVKASKYPEKYKKGASRWSLILGIIGFIIVLAVLIAVLIYIL